MQPNLINTNIAFETNEYHDFADQFLNILKPTFGIAEKKNLEISWVLKSGTVEKNGRLNCWIEGKTSRDFKPVANALTQVNAPAEVKHAQQTFVNPFIEGVGISSSDGEDYYRLYLHGRNLKTQKDYYEAYRWSVNSKLQKYTYSFNYISTQEAAAALEKLIHVDLLPAFKMLISNERLHKLSGYWLRHNESNVIDHVYLCYPWYPLATTLPGMTLLLESLGIDEEAFPEIKEFPVRHIAFKAASDTPGITLYSSAEATDFWAEDEDELQNYVLKSAAKYNKKAEGQVFSALPELSPKNDAIDIGNFYDGAIDLWKGILGAKMHYHFGMFKSNTDCSQNDLQEALDNAVTTLYPLLPAGGRIYDIGCGWGGPLAMIVNDLKCKVLGLTPSLTQFQYISSLGYDVRLGDAEQTLPPGYFDCILMLESLCHIMEKERLLSILKFFSPRLVMRVSCQDHYPSEKVFGDSMLIISSTELKNLLEKTGWKIKHWKNVREQSLPSIRLWNDCVQATPVTNDTHVETLRSWASHASTDPVAWGQHNPLIEVMAERA